MERKTIIYYLKSLRDSRPTAATREKKALEEAIASLKAWDKVIAELDEKIDEQYVDKYDFCYQQGIEFALDIINKHLGEVNGR